MGSSLRRRQQFEFQYQCPSLVWKCEKIRIGCEGGAPASASASTACGDDDDALIVRRRSEERPSYYGSSYWYLMMMQVEAMVKQVGRRIRSRWKQRRSKGGNVQYYNYDLRSYAQNFDDGRRGNVHDDDDDDHRPSRFGP